ncbi:hypothetical protein DFJ58DRAFT_657096, partial [Suillus subalutaceus]|uniref:uncharacterized protein n=1 Tax=Suillus subalutaceus TaxID=48586 RepID=UPI001B87519C
DEVEWVAGISVLRSVIRTGLLIRKHEYEQLLLTHEGRWNLIKDKRCDHTCWTSRIIRLTDQNVI